MAFFELNFKNYNLETYDSKNHEVYKLKNMELHIFGYFCGGVSNIQIENKQDLIDRILTAKLEGNHKKVNSLMRTVVGPCYFIFIIDKEISIYASASSYGCFIAKEKEHIFVTNGEGHFYENIHRVLSSISFNELLLFNSVVSHHSVIRAPFEGLIKSSLRCPPGCYYVFNENKTYKNCFLILETDEINEEEYSEKNLENIIENVSKVLVENLSDGTNNFKIAFSGGIDSSMILSVFKDKINRKEALYYKDYGTEDEKTLAYEIAKYFDCNIDAIKDKDRVIKEFIIKKGISGLGTLVGEYIFLTGGRASPYEPKDTRTNKFALTGQNADTLFHIDHFGPDNREMGLSRLIYLLYFLRKRIYYSLMFYKQAWFLKLPPFFVPMKHFRATHKEFLKSTFSGIDEHVAPFDENKINTPANFNRYEFQKFRNDIFFEPLARFIKDKYSIDLNQTSIADIDPYIANHISRLSRWFRSINNFAQQFGNLSINENYNVLIFFAEGPISSRLMNYRINFIENFKIKRFIQNIFKKKSKASYNSFRYKAFHDSNIIKFIISDFKRLIQIITRKLNRKKEVLKLNNFQNEDIKKGDFSFSKLIKEIMVDINSEILLQTVEDKRIKNYFKNIFFDIKDKNLDCLSRERKMEICRFVNLNLMVSQIKLKKNET